jgi:hypothetical protein
MNVYQPLLDQLRGPDAIAVQFQEELTDLEGYLELIAHEDQLANGADWPAKDANDE